MKHLKRIVEVSSAGMIAGVATCFIWDQTSIMSWMIFSIHAVTCIGLCDLIRLALGMSKRESSALNRRIDNAERLMVEMDKRYDKKYDSLVLEIARIGGSDEDV